MLALALLPLMALAPQGSVPRELDIPSDDGRWVARVRKMPGQERVDDRLARWELAVHDTSRGEVLWSCPFPRHGPVVPEEGQFFLSADGSTLARVAWTYAGSRPVVFVHRFGAVVAEIEGGDLRLERSQLHVTGEGTTWFGAEGDVARMDWFESEVGPWLGLELESSRGWQRRIDLSAGEVHEDFEWAPQVSPIVHPELVDLVRPPTVSEVRVDPYALFGVPVRVTVIGTHPTPNWQQGGFGLQVLGEDGTELVVLPMSQPPPTRSFSAQVIEGFSSNAQLLGLAPGRHTVTAHGAEPEEARVEPRSFEVLPGRLRARLETSGGIAGVDDSVELFVPGVARIRRGFDGEDGPRLRHVHPDVLDRIDAVLVRMPHELRSSAPSVGSDHFRYRLGYWAGDAWVQAELDDGNARGVVAELIDQLRRL
jgi:hypothetical protein